MPIIELRPIQEPMDEKEVVGRLQAGWIIAGQILVSKGNGVATPDNPTGQVMAPCNIWILPEPMVPISEVYQVLLNAAEQYKESGPGMLALGYISHLLIGMTIEDLQQKLEEYLEEPGESPSPSQDSASTMA